MESRLHTTPSISQLSYPYLNQFHAVIGNRLYLINDNGELEPDEYFSSMYRDALSAFEKQCQHGFRRIQLGYFLPIWPKQPDQLWLNASTLVLNQRTYQQLVQFESAMKAYLATSNISSFPVTKEMSVYAGMRRLVAFGAALGLYPVVTLDEMNEPIVVNLDVGDEARFQPFQTALRDKLLSCDLLKNCQVRPFLEAIMQADEPPGINRT